MPNGGYPMHLMTPIGDSGMSFLISGQYVNLRQMLEPENDSTDLGRPRFHDFGALTGAQTHDLMSHLVTWISAGNDTANDTAQGDSLIGGEYGRDLELAVGQSAMLISVSTWHINVRRVLEHERDSSGVLHPRYFEYGGLNEIQTAALLFHLLEWKGFAHGPTLEEVQGSLSPQGFHLRPHFNKHGCIYDY
jgi:hypothetical protein